MYLLTLYDCGSLGSCCRMLNSGNIFSMDMQIVVLVRPIRDNNMTISTVTQLLLHFDKQRVLVTDAIKVKKNNYPDH